MKMVTTIKYEKDKYVKEEGPFAEIKFRKIQKTYKIELIRCKKGLEQTVRCGLKTVLISVCPRSPQKVK